MPLFPRFVAFERLWVCSIGVNGTWGKAVESESPSQAMALSSHQLSTLLVRWAQVGTSGQRQAPKFNNV